MKYTKNTSTFTLEQVLICAHCQIAVNGWVSTKDANEFNSRLSSPADSITPTKDNVCILLQDGQNGKVARKALMAAAKEKGIDLFDDAIKKEVQAATKWAIGLIYQPDAILEKHMSEYDEQISLIATVGHVEFTKLGFAVSIIPSYQRQKNTRSKSNWVGSLSKHIESVVSVVGIKESAPPGHWWLVTAKDTDGNALKWFATAEPKFLAGVSIRINGTVVKHEDWKGYKATKLMQVSVENL